MNKEYALFVAEHVMANGNFTYHGWYDDGDAESGPMGGRIYLFRLGSLSLEMTRNGSIFLFLNKQDEMGMPKAMQQIYSSTFGTKDRRVSNIVERFHAEIGNVE